MKIHKEGKNIILISCAITVILVIATLYAPFLSTLPKILIIAFFVITEFLIIRFFRIPNRDLVNDDNLIISPADGTIVAIEKVFEKEFFNDTRLQISIFMSIYDVHANLYPVSGKIVYSKYHKGKYIVARHPKSSQLNEHYSVVVKNPAAGEILVKQIAGAVARRIVNYSEVNTEVKQGEQIGFIKFGSRVDLFLPSDTELKINLKQKVKAGITPIAVINRNQIKINN
ncbi:MAG: phosphatidylserine decarboxylase family protein [Bacteroidales bacterium]